MSNATKRQQNAWDVRGQTSHSERPPLRSESLSRDTATPHHDFPDVIDPLGLDHPIWRGFFLSHRRL